MTERFPSHGFGWKALGVFLKQLDRYAEALEPMRKSVVLSPEDVEAHNNLGVILRNLSQIDEAVLCYRRALAIKPDYADAYINLASALHYQGVISQALTCCRHALTIQPYSAAGHNNLGNILRDIGSLDAAESSYRLAVQIEPEFADVFSNLGATLHDLGRHSEAEMVVRRAVEIKPDDADAYNNLDFVLDNLDRQAEAKANYQRALAIAPDAADVHSNLLLSGNFLPTADPAEIFAEARRYGDIVSQRATPYTSWCSTADPARPLRVGLVSGDFFGHPVGYFLEGNLKALAGQFARQLQFFAYSCAAHTDALTGRLKACCQAWHSAVGQSEEAFVRKIHADGIDILIDLSGHTANNRLPVFAWKPAPVQVSWLGYFATTGVTAIDYLIADPWVLPESEEAYFTEKIWRLPETRLCFTPPEIDLAVSPLPALANGYVTFASFANLAKMNDGVVALWSRVLKSVPRSRLLLKAKQLADASVRQRTLERFAAHGVAAERIILEGPEAREKYLAVYHRVDIVLDTTPFAGGTTSVESLWMGVPVLTLAGERCVSRQGVGILMNAGLPAWVAEDSDDYVVRSSSHANDLQRLTKLRQGLRRQVLGSPVMDAKRFAGYFESALRGMWQRWCLSAATRKHF